MVLTWDFWWLALRINGLIRSIHGTEIKAIITKKLWTSCCKTKTVRSYHFKVIAQHTSYDTNGKYVSFQLHFIWSDLKHCNGPIHPPILGSSQCRERTVSPMVQGGQSWWTRESPSLYSFLSKCSLTIHPHHVDGACHWTEVLMSHIIKATLFVPRPLDSVPWGQSALALDKEQGWHCTGHSGVTKSPWVTLSHKLTVPISNLIFPVLLSPLALFFKKIVPDAHSLIVGELPNGSWDAWAELSFAVSLSVTIHFGVRRLWSSCLAEAQEPSHFIMLHISFHILTTNSFPYPPESLGLRTDPELLWSKEPGLLGRLHQSHWKSVEMGCSE